MNPVKAEQLFHDQALQIGAGIGFDRRDGSGPMLLQDVAVRAFERAQARAPADPGSRLAAQAPMLPSDLEITGCPQPAKYDTAAATRTPIRL